jgi:hypothetical protein
MEDHHLLLRQDLCCALPDAYQVNAEVREEEKFQPSGFHGIVRVVLTVNNSE